MMIPIVGVTNVEVLSINTAVAFDPSGRTGWPSVLAQSELSAVRVNVYCDGASRENAKTFWTSMKRSSDHDVKDNFLSMRTSTWRNARKRSSLSRAKSS